jgi:hypothetical protein
MWLMSDSGGIAFVAAVLTVAIGLWLVLSG